MLKENKCFNFLFLSALGLSLINLNSLGNSDLKKTLAFLVVYIQTYYDDNQKEDSGTISEFKREKKFNLNF